MPLVRPDMIEGLKRYRDERIEPGGFLLSVLQNRLKEACSLADEDNRLAIYEIVCWCYNNLPSVSWGSPEAVRQWLCDHSWEHPAVGVRACEFCGLEEEDTFAVDTSEA